MYHNYRFLDVNQALPHLMHELMGADEIGSRNGRVKELTHVGTTLDCPMDREILIPERKANIAAQIAETMWVLSGRDDIGWLRNYLPRVDDFSDDGKTWRAGYGARMRYWGTDTPGDVRVVDQWRYAIDLLRRDPSSRQAVISLWDPVVDTQPGKDIPCNDWLHFLSRHGSLDLHVAVRSNDIIWGWSGINAFEWSTLLEVTAGILGLNVGGLHFSTTSLHVYDKHWAKAEKISNTGPRVGVFNESPRFSGVRSLEDFDRLSAEWFDLEEKIRTGEYVRNRVNHFPEPMMRSWLRVLQWWWSGDRAYLKPLEGTRLEVATTVALQPTYSKDRPLPSPAPSNFTWEKKSSLFLTYATGLHNEKHKAYGDSWKRRGEMLGIMANIARKVDRLGANGGGDTAADTAIDLMVYLAKYRTWLFDEYLGGHQSDTPDAANSLLDTVDSRGTSWSPVKDVPDAERVLTNNFEALEIAVTHGPHRRTAIVDLMLNQAYRLARTLWENGHGDDYRGADHD